MSAALRAGYKQTEVGVIPQDWDVKTLGSCLIDRPSYGINAAAVPYSDKLPAYVRITDIGEDGRLLPGQRVSVRSEMSGNFYLFDGDIVLARTGASVGKSYRYNPDDGPLVYAGFLIRIRPNCERLLSIFAAAYVTTANYWRWVRLMSMRSGQPGINGNEFAQLPVALPALPEQRAIAAALSDVDALLAGLGRLIAKKRDLKQAAMQQLLTGQTRLPGFQGEWHWKRMGDVCRITTGKKDVNQGNPAGQYPFFTCARDNTFSDSFSFDSEAILIAGNGEVGNLSYFKGKFEAYQRTYVLQDFSVGVTFLWHQLTAYLAASLGIGTIGSSIPYIKKGNLVNFEFKAPLDHGEQTAIAQVLSDMDAELTALQARRDKTCALKQAMMQELLTGKTRLV